MMQHVRLALFLSVVCRSVVLLSGGGAVEAEQAAGEECVYKWKEQGSKDSKGVGVIGVSGRVHRARCRRLCGVVFSCVCFWCWLACFLACWGVHVSLWWGGVWCGWVEVAGRGLCWATRRCTCQTVSGGHRTHQTKILLEVSFLPILLAIPTLASMSCQLQRMRMV